MLIREYSLIACTSFLPMAGAARGLGQDFDLSWYTVDCGGAMFTTGGGFELSGTIGQPDAGVMTGGTFELVGGFWPGVATAGAGVPAATITGAVLRKPNTAGPGGVCDMPVDLAAGGTITSEPREGGVTELRIAFDVTPGAPGANPVILEEDATCPSPPSYGPYTGASTTSATVEGNELVLTFTPALENARTYRITLGTEVTSIAAQSVEIRGLIGDVDSSGRTNAIDRSLVVSAWTSPANFSCETDLDSSGRTNATDRSLAVSSWTSPQNCAP